MTPNGKVDRKNLPAPQWETGPATDDFVPPRDAVEVQVMRIWESLLGRYPIGVREDFFDIGGHSLLVLRIVDRVNQLFDRQLPVDVLWHGARTVETLSALVRSRMEEGDPIWSRAVPIKRSGSRRPIFCAPIAGGHLFFPLTSGSGQLSCAAFEPTKNFRAIIKQLAASRNIRLGFPHFLN